LIPLLRATNEYIYKAYLEFFEIIKNSGMKIKTFKHIVDEVNSIIKNSYQWINDSKFDRAKANRVAIYFFENQEHSSVLNYLNENLEKAIREDLGIDIEEFDYNKSNHNYIIDEKLLYNTINDIYNKHNLNEYFEELRYFSSINTDIKSIIAIQCLRESKKPDNFSESKYILATKNWGLLKATKEYSKSPQNEDITNIIHLDSFICANLWNTQIKSNIIGFYKDKLISDCIVAIQTPRKFYKKFIEAVKEYANKKNISKESVLALMSDHEYINDWYIHNTNKSDYILEDMKEVIEKYKARLTNPINEKHEKQINEIQTNHKKVVDTIIAEKDGLKNENIDLKLDNKQLESKFNTVDQKLIDVKKKFETEINQRKLKIKFWVHKSLYIAEFILLCLSELAFNFIFTYFTLVNNKHMMLVNILWLSLMILIILTCNRVKLDIIENYILDYLYKKDKQINKKNKDIEELIK